MNLIDYIVREKNWSLETFGPGKRTIILIKHIQKELIEVEAAPTDLEEWIDIIILAIDGAWRVGYSPEDIAMALQSKQLKNEKRRWPDWRTLPLNEPVEHLR